MHLYCFVSHKWQDSYLKRWGFNRRDIFFILTSRPLLDVGCIVRSTDCLEKMGFRGLPPIHPGSSIPELISSIRHAFREREFDEVQNALMEREKGMKIEILNLSRICDSLKKDIDFLESSERCADLENSKREKLGLEEKLSSSRRECEERDDRLVRMGKEIEDLRREKLSLEEKLNSSCSKCEEGDDKLLRMGKEIEDLRREKLSLEEKLNSYCSKCEERDDKLARMGKEIEDLRCEKLSLEEKFNSSRSKCDERDDKLVRMGKEIEDLRCEKLSLEEKLNGTCSKCELRSEKLSLEEKLNSSCSKCEERDAELVRLRKRLKSSLVENLDNRSSECEERDQRLVRMEKEIEDLRREKLSLEKKLDCSLNECEQRNELVVQMLKDIDDLSHEKHDANQTIKELKRKEIEATQAIDELRARLETALAKMLCVNVGDLSELINGLDFFTAAVTDVEEENLTLSSSENDGTDCLGNENVNPGGSGGVRSSKTGGRDLAPSRTKVDGANVICTSGSAYCSAVAERNGIVQDNGGTASEVRDKNASLMLKASDGERRLRNKRRSIIDDISGINWSAKKKRGTPASASASTSTPARVEESLADSGEESLADSDDESCSDEFMDKLVASIRGSRRQ